MGGLACYAAAPATANADGADAFLDGANVYVDAVVDVDVAFSTYAPHDLFSLLYRFIPSSFCV